MGWSEIQAFMKGQRIDGWLVFDFRCNNSVLARLIPAPAGVRRWTTRRAALYIPASGTPTLLAQALDAGQFKVAESRGVTIETYISWAHLRAWLERGCGG